MASIIKVNNVQNTAAGKNIINESGNTVTIGASGDTVTLAAGASQSGFGQTYSAVEWDTTAKTTTVTGVAGVGYFINTTGGAITANLPAGTAGDVIAFADYAATWQTNKVTVVPNGTEKIGSFNVNATLSTEGQSVTLVYVDSTQGWLNTMDSTSNIRGNPFMVASVSGACNTLTTSGDCKIATFTGPGTFTVGTTAVCAANNVVSYMVVAGGGGSGSRHGGGGGAGGFREYKSPVTPYTASPLNGNPGGTAVTVSTTAYPIVIGGGGTAGRSAPTPIQSGGLGVNSVFSTITSTGGGGGVTAAQDPGQPLQLDGGSGGGGALCGMVNFPTRSPSEVAGTGNTPPVSPSQGFPGGSGGNPGPYSGGGGGGATAAGALGNPIGGVGGAGGTTSINGSPTSFAGGGGGGGYVEAGGAGGIGGGGAGGPEGTQGTAGTINTGGGAGGTGNQQPGLPSGTAPQAGATGGSGIVIIRYKFK